MWISIDPNSSVSKTEHNEFHHSGYVSNKCLPKLSVNYISSVILCQKFAVLLTTRLLSSKLSMMIFTMLTTLQRKKLFKTLSYKPNPLFGKKFWKLTKIFCKNRSAYRRINMVPLTNRAQLLKVHKEQASLSKEWIPIQQIKSFWCVNLVSY